MSLHLSQQNIGFVGGGNMARSLASGLIAGGVDPQRIMISDPSEQSRQSSQESFHCRVTDSNCDCAKWSTVLVLATKPQIAGRALAGISSSVDTSKSLVISVAAGLTTDLLAAWFSPRTAIVRVMPNTPALVSEGASGMFANANVNRKQKNLTETIMAAVGLAEWVDDEALMDVVTALSGSGPAYFFLLLEAMQNAAISLGLPADMAGRLSVQTGLGACRMAKNTQDDVSTLREKVTSPGGTTAAALAVLKAEGLQKHVHSAMQAAVERGKEMAAAQERQLS